MATGADMVRAARLLARGQQLQIRELALAEPRADEVRVRLTFGGVNPIDRYNAEGRVNPDGPVPRTLGNEAAGELDGRPILV
ncbi:MAG: quinone oxidoreductase family protein, partial [Solirubrobacteraceae bacterium]